MTLDFKVYGFGSLRNKTNLNDIVSTRSVGSGFMEHLNSAMDHTVLPLIYDHLVFEHHVFLFSHQPFNID